MKRFFFAPRKQIRKIVSNSWRLLIIFDKLDIKCVSLLHFCNPWWRENNFIVRRRADDGEGNKKFHKNDLEGI